MGTDPQTSLGPPDSVWNLMILILQALTVGLTETNGGKQMLIYELTSDIAT